MRTTLPGITLLAPGATAMRPTVATTSPLRVARKRLAEQHRLGGTGERIAPQHHRHGAGMPGFAEKLDVEIGLSDDGGHDAERLVARLQHRSLLDVDFDVGRDLIARIGGGRDVVRRFAVGLDRVARASRRCGPPVSGFRCGTRPRTPRTRTASRESASPPRRRRRARRSRTAAACRARMKCSAARMPAITPNGPSYFPASITVSMCEPISRRLAPSKPPAHGAERVLGNLEPGLAHPARRRDRRRAGARARGTAAPAGPARPRSRRAHRPSLRRARRAHRSRLGREQPLRLLISRAAASQSAGGAESRSFLASSKPCIPSRHCSAIDRAFHRLDQQQ